MTRARVIVIAVVAGLVALGAVVVTRHASVDGVASARRVLQRESRFANGPSAGTAFADVSHLLLQDAKACARRHSSADQRCAALYSAAAYASVTAFALLECTQPGVYQARRAALVQLDGITGVDRAHGRARAPRVPEVPSCA